MGRVRTKTTKRTARKIIERSYQTLTLDFHTNKRVRVRAVVWAHRRWPMGAHGLER